MELGDYLDKCDREFAWHESAAAHPLDALADTARTLAQAIAASGDPMPAETAALSEAIREQYPLAVYADDSLFDADARTVAADRAKLSYALLVPLGRTWPVVRAGTLADCAARQYELMARYSANFVPVYWRLIDSNGTTLGGYPPAEDKQTGGLDVDGVFRLAERMRKG